ncbi:MAG: hypothetical protein IJX90_12155 [Blautia sp.]|nr:hypothetical protein [Blautia sp.]
MNYRKMMNLHLFDEGGNGGQNAGTGNGGQGNAGSGNGGRENTGGTFTYEQLDEIATSRADRASKAALKSYFQQQGLSEQEAAAALEQYKKDKAARQPDASAIEKERDQYKAQLEERDNKDYLRDKNIKTEDLDYVMFKAKQLMDDKTDFKKAADKFLKENPRFTGNGYRVSTSSASGSEGSTGSKNTSINDAIRNAARR